MTDGILQVLLLTLVVLCAVTDLNSGTIHNCIVVPFAAAGMGIRIYFGGLETLPAAGMSLLVPFAAFYPVWRLTKGKGIGAGDIKLLMSVAVLSPLWSVLPIFAVSFAGAAVWGVIASLYRQTRTGVHLAVFVAIGAGLHLIGFY